MFPRLSPSDWVAIANVAIVSATLMVLIRQLTIQNRIAKAQLLRDRFEMYWKTYDPVTKEQVEELDMNPEDYMPLKVYEASYRDDEKAKRKYLMLAHQYEYLAFTFALTRLGIRDPMGGHWLGHWARDLASHREFVEVNQHYRSYYPEFAKLVDRLAPKRRA